MICDVGGRKIGDVVGRLAELFEALLLIDRMEGRYVIVGGWYVVVRERHG